MKMNLWNTNMQFKYTLPSTDENIDPKWIRFNSEISIRKGGEGWVINSRFDNLSNSSQNFLGYILTKYKYESNKWQKDGESKLWMDPEPMNGSSKMISSGSIVMGIQDRTLTIKSPGATWFSNSDWISESYDHQTNIKKQLKDESWSGIWIDNEESNSWIFQDIELYVGKKEYSQVFCEGEDNVCFQSSSTTGGSIKNPEKLDTWSNAAATHNYANEQIKNVIPTTMKEIIKKLRDSKGSWTKLENVCEVDGEPTEEQQKQLRMYCSKGRASK